MVEFAPIETLSSTNVFKNSLGGFLDFGNLSFVKVTFGPMKTSSSMMQPKRTGLLSILLRVLKLFRIIISPA